LFYPSDETELAMTVSALMRDARPAADLTPKALIVPHAGYIYSGPTAAKAYGLLGPLHDRIKRVVLMGLTHRIHVRGLALPGCAQFATPLGLVEVDAHACEQLVAHSQLAVVPQAHAAEHSIEVQLPFLQMLLQDFQLVPILVGDTSAEKVAEVLEALWGGDETLIVISSDLSHYLPYAQAQSLDGASCARILALDDQLSHEEACGATAIRGLLLAARKHHLQPHLLDLRNSGDTAGDKSKVVGYAAFAFTNPASADDMLGEALLVLARATITHQLGQGPRPIVANLPALRRPGASFVTLYGAGSLRGCIGSLTAQRALADDVEANALAAAFRDPRFRPLAVDELASLRVEVSILSAAEPLHCRDEADALRQLRPHVDGVILECGPRRATFLPQVWEQLPERAAFLAHLKRKAGLADDFWSPELHLSRYSVRKWQEAEGSL
jgi:AmmeMemoRadiSam system protein B/AmmeMemoRadiSam system protein A